MICELNNRAVKRGPLSAFTPNIPPFCQSMFDLTIVASCILWAYTHDGPLFVMILIDWI
jgi:hypothetical protein